MITYFMRLKNPALFNIEFYVSYRIRWLHKPLMKLHLLIDVQILSNSLAEGVTKNLVIS